MLYERWRQIALGWPRRVALRDLTSGSVWTFGELAELIENEPISLEGAAFPQGNSAEFIFSILRAWRAGQVVYALDSGQTLTAFSGPLPKSVVHLKSTSATTGVSRLVAFTANQLQADADNIVATMGLTPTWPNLGVISLTHSYGFSNLVLPLLLHGVPLILVGSVLPEALRRAAATEAAIALPGVPALWSKWHEADAIPDNVRIAISAGAPLPLKLEESVFKMHGLKIHNFYGSTECGGIAYDASDQPRTDNSCAGAPLRNVAVSVNASGCLEVRSRAVGETYLPDPSPNLTHGVFQTSDLAAISDGLVYLAGRISDQINIAGRKVLPETIEWVLTMHPAVRECVAFGVPSPDAERGETIVACLAVNPEVSGESLKQYMMGQLPAWQVPRKWWFVESLGANSRGKVSRAEWRRRYLEKVKD